MSKAILLANRGVVEVAGADAEKFLHNILTNSIAGLPAGEARFAALLAPQGKILFDFLVFPVDEGGARRLLLDCPRELAADLARRLAMYKLRAQIDIKDKSEEIEAFAFLDGPPRAPALAAAADPRSQSLGFRALAEKGAVSPTADIAEYEAARIAAGVPLGGVDFRYNDAFPHEANMDRLGGVDFKKGCYVGQEVVSRMQHRGLTKKRVTPFRALGEPPAPGSPIMGGDKEIGIAGSHSGANGLALIRLDRLAEAGAAGLEPTSGGVMLEFPAAPG